MQQFDDAEIDNMIAELNPDINFKTIKHHDSNWAALKQAAAENHRFDTSRCIKTKSPTLMQFERHYGFVYRRFDGSSWHTELCQVDTENKSRGLTPNQRLLKDNIDTIFALKRVEHKLKWITPTNKTSKEYDPRYQLLQFGSSWMCCINDEIYEASNTRQPPNRTHKEITFSTRSAPLFTIENTNKILDIII
jgi:hypothetical protein